MDISKNNLLLSESSISDDILIKEQEKVFKPISTTNTYDSGGGVKLFITSTTFNAFINPKEPLKKDEHLIVLNLTKDNSYEWQIVKQPRKIRNEIKTIRSAILKAKVIAKGSELEEELVEVENMNEEQMMFPESLNKIAKALADLHKDPSVNIAFNMTEYFQISKYSFFLKNVKQKPLEAYAEKEAEPRKIRTVMKIFCNFMEFLIFKHWNKRWVVLKEDMLFYSNGPYSSAEKYVYYFDNSFEVFRPYDNNLLTVKNLSRELTLKFEDDLQCQFWEKKVKEAVLARKMQLHNNVFKSFTNEKAGNCARFLIDGENYFSLLRDKLLKANDSVFFTDWWMSPQVFLKRPVKTDLYAHSGLLYHDFPMENNYSRLMDIINHIASKGVKVFILVYKEVEAALTLNSAHTKRMLDGLHSNVKVTRHPRNVSVSSDILWSHHEKLVIIDQAIAFVGGLDLCWGRYDTNDHPIIEPPNDEREYLFPFIDYSNARINDFSKVEEYLEENVDRSKFPRMPWHDVVNKYYLFYF
ncbi:MAG: hypothetical protein MJ252_04380 [archaeon]|nr:hypothetical protein [archaeon]